MKRLVVVAVWSFLVSSGVLVQRLPENVVPDSYDLKFEPDLGSATFAGDETIHVHLLKATTSITLNAAEIEFKESWVGSADFKQAAAVAKVADGAVVGSALVDRIAGNLDAAGRAKPDLAEAVLSLVRELAAGVRESRSSR